jgi:alpha-aminoadipate carrier protein LysW
MMGTCPDCDENFEIGDATEVGQVVECPSCKAQLEILDLHPVILDYAVDKDELEALER